MNRAVRWSDAEKRPLMCAVVGLVGRDPVAIRELPMDLGVKVSECFAHVAIKLPYPRLIRRRPWLRCVVDEVIGKQLIEQLEVSFPLHLVGISPDDGFGCF